MEQRFRRSLSIWGLIKFKLIIDGKPFYFMIDTGCSHNCITPEAAERLKDRIKHVGKVTSFGYSGKITEKAVRIPLSFNHQKLEMSFSIMKYTKDFRLMEGRGIHLDGI